MNFNEDTITIFYKSGIHTDKEALGYAQSVREHVHEIDVTKTPVTSTQLMEIIDTLGVDIEELIDKESDLYQEEYPGMSFDTNGWLTVLTKNPELLKTPIVFIGDRGMIVESGRDIIKFGASEKKGL